MKKKCKLCDKNITAARVKALPDTEICIECARVCGPTRKQGILFYKSPEEAPTFHVVSGTSMPDNPVTADE